MKLARLTVRSGWHERKWCPVQTKLALDADVDLNQLSLWDLVSDVPVPVQAWPADDGQVDLAWVVSSVEPNGVGVYELRYGNGAEPAETKGVELEETKPGELKVTVGGEHFTTYNFGDGVVRPYLYPVIAHGGMSVTRNWPMVEDVPGETTDHPHHKGIYTAHGDVDGVNNWGEGAGHGWIVHRDFTHLFSGRVMGGFTEELEWTDSDKEANATETRRVVFYLTPARARVFDYEVTLHASKGEVTLGDTKEGGILSLRVAPSMNVIGPQEGGLGETGGPEGGRMENAYGAVNEAEVWGNRAPWCDYSGPRAGEWRGVALMDHPDNPRYPTYWHARNYGLMTANPIGLHDFSGDPSQRWDLVIPAGESVGWRYRIVVHDGDATAAKVGERWHDFVNPPQTEVE